MAGARKSGGPKREFTWQVQGIGHVVKIVAGAVFRGRCQNVGRRVLFEGLHFTWCREFAPWTLCILRSKGSIPQRGFIFGT